MEEREKRKKEKRSRNSCWYQTGLTTYFGRKPHKTWLWSESKSHDCVTLHRPNSRHQAPPFLSLPVCCVVNLPRWVLGLWSRKPSKAQLHLLTYYGVDTNSGEAVEGPPVALTNISVLYDYGIISYWICNEIKACLVVLVMFIKWHQMEDSIQNIF